MDETSYIEELVRRGGDDLDEALALVGIYVEDKSVVAREGPDGHQFAIAIDAALGRLAFGPRVQDPEGNTVDEIFTGVTENLEREDADEAHRLFRERLSSFEPDDDSGGT
jgi:hypothetical protein